MSDDTLEQQRCPSCDAAVHEDWRFCRECGIERPGLYDAPAVSADPDASPVGPPGGSLVRWRLLDAGIVFALSLLATFLVAGLAAVALGSPLTDAEVDTVTIASLLANQLSLLAGAWLWLRRWPGSVRDALAFGPFKRRYAGIGMLTGLGGVGISAVVAAVVTTIAEKLQGAPPAPPDQIPLEQDPTALVLVILAISTVLLAPLAEEVFFRGMVHQSVRRRWRFVPAMLLSSSLFAVAHIDPLVVPSIFALAVVLTIMYERQRSLWVPIIAHATFNVVGFSATFLLAGAIAAPSGIGAEPTGSREITITWTDETDGETGFRIESRIGDDAWDELAVLPADTERYVDATAPPSDERCYRVRTLQDEDASEPSRVACATSATS